MTWPFFLMHRSEFHIKKPITRLVVSDDIDLIFARAPGYNIVLKSAHKSGLDGIKLIERRNKLVLLRTAQGSVPVTVILATPTVPPIALLGSGRVELSALQQGELDIEMAGSCDIIATGQVEHIRVSSSDTGTGHLNALGLCSSTANVQLNGSGSIEVTAMDALQARLTGLGTLRVHGRPHIRSAQVLGQGVLKFC